ncbi:MAG: NAD-dependent epimerase/dehydratase family protein [Mycobacteriales bacterium]
MPPKVVLVTGVSRYLGSRLAAQLAAEEKIERVIGVDTAPPRREMLQVLGRTEFVRADIRSPQILKVVAGEHVDTVVHLDITAIPSDVGGRSSMKERNVIGTMQLLAACQRSDHVRKLVLKSSTAVYGSSPRDPALFTEEDGPKEQPRSGFAKDAAEIEGYVRGFARRRPDVAVSLLRFANFLSPHLDTPLTRYFTLPAMPVVFGHDPRLQFIHLDDGLEVMRLATVDDRPGTVNVAGAGVLPLSQAIRRAGRVAIPVLPVVAGLVGRAVRGSRLVDFSPEQLAFLRYGRGVDTSRLTGEFGYLPRYTTVQAFDDFVRGRNLTSPISPAVLEVVEQAILDRIRGDAREDDR